MGQKVNPIGLRLGIVRGWDSNWYGGKNYANKLVEDNKIRKYLNARLSKSGISKIYIERTLKLVTVTIYAVRPGFIIGSNGSEIDKLREELKKLTNKEIQINIAEVKRPDLEAILVAQFIAKQIEGRSSYKKAVRIAIENAMRASAEGIKVTISGRVGGAEMARSEHFKEGRTPLHTLRADIDFSQAEAHTTYGRIGVKVWIFRGFVYGKPDLFTQTLESREPKGLNKFGDRRDGGRMQRRDNRDGDRRDNNRGGGDRRDRRDNNNRDNRNNNNNRNGDRRDRRY